MRIALHSPERPKRVAKALRNHLAALGRDIPFSTVREGVAAMYGYRSWNDLLGQAGRGAPSPYDQEAPEGVAAQRRATFSRRLAEALAIPFDVAQAAVDAVGPTSRRSRAVSARWTWPEALERMAANLSRCPAESVSLVIEGDASGYRCLLPVDHDAVIEVEDREILARKYRTEQPAYELLVRPDGSVVYRSFPDDGEDLHDTVAFSMRLQEAGLHGGDTPGHAPHELILRTLSRLDGHAISMLRTVPIFAMGAYDIARSVVPGSPWAEAVHRLPMLGAEMDILANGPLLRTIPASEDRLRVALLTDAQPVERYLDLVALAARQFHAGIPFDREAARTALEAVASIPVLQEAGLGHAQVAFLSLAPPATLPREPAQAAAALNLALRLHGLFTDRVGFSPKAAFAGFDGDWTALAAAVARAGAGYDLPLSAVTDPLAHCLFWERGLSIEGYNDWEFEVPRLILRTRLAPVLAAGRDILGYVAGVAAWQRERHRNAPTRDVATPEGMLSWTRGSLDITGALPPSLAHTSASDLARSVGIDPDAFVEAVMSGAEASRDEMEVSLTLPGMRAAVAESVRLNPCMRGLLSGTTTFHVAEIGGLVLRALHSNHGPYLHVEGDNPDRMGASLGIPAHVGWFPPANGNRAQLWIFTSGKSRLRLPDRWGAAELEALRAEFGIGDTYGTPDGFLASRAMEGLVAWTESHPRMADRFADDDRNVPGWYHIARCRAGSLPGNAP